MTVPVRYYCPRCGSIGTLERDPYMADKSVTPFPLEGREYATPEDDFEDADGVRLVCGEHTDDESRRADVDVGRLDGDGERADEGDDGCGEPFYLNFVRYRDGRELEPVRESEYVELGAGTGPTRPPGPDGPSAD